MGVVRTAGKRLGEFRLVRSIGKGAMGEVWEAIQESLGRRVALKILPEDFARDANTLERFHREAQAAAKLQHRHIVPVYGAWMQDGTAFYAMELVRGRSLKDVIAAGPPDPRKLGKWGIQVAEALEYAHKAGVIHRDVKPANIIIRDENEDAALADFGLARLDDARSITRSGVILGTPLYMSPEQALGEPAEKRSDVWALGVTLYEGLAGRTPFESNDLRDLIIQITERDPSPIAGAPWELEAIVLKALAKEPKGRYASAREMADDIIRFMRGEVIRAARTPVGLLLAKSWKRHTALWVVALTSIALVVTLPLLSARRARLTAEAKLGEAMKLELEARSLREKRSSEEAARAAEERSREEGASRELAAAEALVRAPLDEWRRRSEVLAKRIAFRSETQLQGDAARLEAASRSVSDEREAVFATEERLADVSVEALARLDGACAVAGSTAVSTKARALAVELLRALRRWSERHGETRLLQVFERDERRFAATAAVPSSATLLSVRTQPPGARARLVRVRDDGGRRVEGPTTVLGVTPLDDHPVRGVAIVELELEGHVPCRVPVRIDERTSVAVRLVAREDAPDGFVYLPAGELVPLRDPAAIRARDAGRPSWVDSFFMARNEVTLGEYLEFVNAADPQERVARLPAREQIRLGANGRYEPADPRPGEDATRYPAAGVSFESAEAYARWRAAKEDVPYRLPTEEEWELAAGAGFVVGFPWGERSTGKEANVACDPEPGRLPVRPVGSFPLDRSIFGCEDMAGEVAEWTASSFAPGIHVVKGGSFAKTSEAVRLASREPVDQALFRAAPERFGFRLASGPKRRK